MGLKKHLLTRFKTIEWLFCGSVKSLDFRNSEPTWRCRIVFICAHVPCAGAIDYVSHVLAVLLHTLNESHLILDMSVTIVAVVVALIVR